MTGKIILTVLILVACFATMQLLEQKVTPQTKTGLVIEGVSDPDLMADNQAKVRVIEHTQEWQDPIIYIVTVSLLLCVWLKTIKKGFVKISEYMQAV